MNSTRDSLRRVLLPGLRSFLRRAVPSLRRAPLISHADRVVGLELARAVDPTARLTVLDADLAPASRIELGHDVFIGRQVELTAAGGGSVRIDDDTSVQDGSIIFGNISVGAHCLFGKYCFVASRGHHFRDRPEWLIRDQDELMLAQIPASAELEKSLVRIEDDCWIAQSVVISPGVYIGRGAVVGANSVVTRDVAPYEIHGGAPNRVLGARLDFKPPQVIDASDGAAIPYFYRGFRLAQKALVRSRPRGIVAARSAACIVLAAAPGGCLTLTGVNGGAAFALRLRINGAIAVTQEVANGAFEIHAAVPATMAGGVPTPLSRSTYVDLEAVGRNAVDYGIRTASVA